MAKKLKIADGEKMAPVEKLNMSKLIAEILGENIDAKTHEVADILTKKFEDTAHAKDIAEMVTKAGFQSTISIQRKKLKGGEPVKVAKSTKKELPSVMPSDVAVDKLVQLVESGFPLGAIQDAIAAIEAHNASQPGFIGGMALTLADIERWLSAVDSERQHLAKREERLAKLAPAPDAKPAKKMKVS